MQIPKIDLASIPKTRFLVIAIIILVIGGAAYLFMRGGGEDIPPVELTMWGTDQKQHWDEVIKAYEAARPHVSIAYSEIEEDRYHRDLVKAFATGEGPDVFMVGNHDVLRYKDFLAPAPLSVMTPGRFDSLFIRAARQDLVLEEEVYGVPLYADTLMLLYNKDLLDRAGVSVPPKTWEELVKAVEVLTKINAQGQVLQSGVALGGSEGSVKHATDIVSLLMLQNGAVVADAIGLPRFGSEEGAAEALQFYSAFGRPGSARYSFESGAGNSLEAFVSGKAALAFGYKADSDTFKSKSPFLNFGVAPMLQTSADAAVNYASYKALGAWARGTNPAEAWNFAMFATTNDAGARTYLISTERTPALRSLIAEVQKDPELGFLGSQALSARSFLVFDYDSMKEIMSDAIREVISGSTDSRAALSRAEARLRLLMSQ